LLFLLIPKNNSHNGHKQHLSTVFNEFIRREIITKNPFLSIHNLPENTQRHIPYNDKEKKLLKEYFERHNPRLGKFCQVQYYLSIRPIELLQVQIRDINMSENYVMIWGGNAKNRKQEAVYFPGSCKKLFTSFKIHKHEATDYLFGHKLITCGRPYNRNRVSELHSAVIKDLQLNKFHTLYSWKHTGACAFHRKYKDVYKLMRHLRHNDVRMTMIYIRQLGLDFKTNNMPKF
jgi:integrase